MLPLPPGLVAITGHEGAGKTSLLRRLGEEPSALWLELSLPGQDDQTPPQVWDALRQLCPHWDTPLQRALTEALDVLPHLGKQLFMLSTGSRRKVALVGLLASGAAVTCLDQPFAGSTRPRPASSASFWPTWLITPRAPGWSLTMKRMRACRGVGTSPWADDRVSHAT